MISKKMLGAALMTVLFAGCATQNAQKSDTLYVHDTEYQWRERIDSIYVDRWRTSYAKGDTVYLTDSVRVYKYRLAHDTVRTRDTVQTVRVEQTETVKTEKKYIFWPMLALMAAGVGLYFWRKWGK